LPGGHAPVGEGDFFVDFVVFVGRRRCFVSAFVGDVFVNRPLIIDGFAARFAVIAPPASAAPPSPASAPPRRLVLGFIARLLFQRLFGILPCRLGRSTLLGFRLSAAGCIAASIVASPIISSPIIPASVVPTAPAAPSSPTPARPIFAALFARFAAAAPSLVACLRRWLAGFFHRFVIDELAERTRRFLSQSFPGSGRPALFFDARRLRPWRRAGLAHRLGGPFWRFRGS
jgi:hypothetical protein